MKYFLNLQKANTKQILILHQLFTDQVPEETTLKMRQKKINFKLLIY